MFIGRFLLPRAPERDPKQDKRTAACRSARTFRRVRRTRSTVAAGYRGAVSSDRSQPGVVKPHLRGWLHLGTFPLAVVAGALLTVLAPAGEYRAAVAVFGVSAALLFGVSALYHRGHWGPRSMAVLKRLDHANIFLIIAGTYTPFTVVLLPPGPARTLLWIVWSGALAGVAFRVLWVGAPRWLYVPVYVALGWVAVAYLPAFADAGPAVLALVV